MVPLTGDSARPRGLAFILGSAVQSRRTPLLVVLAVLGVAGPPGCATTGAGERSVRTDATAAACKVQALVGAAGEVDIIPAGADGVALRVTHHSPPVVRQYLAKLWPQGPPSPLQAVHLERSRPKLAIILDDFGLHPGQLEHVWRIGQPFTYAILPQQQYSAGYAAWLTDRGASILAHLPMEPQDADHMTLPGFLTMAMSPKERLDVFRAHMASMPGAVGWNNHMGSRMTADASMMAALVGASRPDWVILDSRTTPDTALERVATRFGRPSARRHVFIDNERRPEAIARQLQEALKWVQTGTHVVAIGHAYPETAAALRAFVKAHRKDVQLVPVERVASPQAVPRWVRTCQSP